MKCPVCGGPTHPVVLMGSEEIWCDDPYCQWFGAVIDLSEET